VAEDDDDEAVEAEEKGEDEVVRRWERDD